MDFEFSPAQQAARQSARTYLGARCTAESLHRVLDGDAAFDAALWRHVAATGWLGTVVPEVHGGAGKGYLDLCVIAEELGRVLAPIPAGPSVYMATEAVLLSGTEAQCSHWLPRLVRGEAVGSFAVAEGAPRSGVPLRHAAGRTTGCAVPVVDGLSATVLVALAADDEAAGAESLFLVPLQSPGVVRTGVQTIDLTRPAAELRLDGVAAERLGAAGEGAALLERLQRRWAVQGVRCIGSVSQLPVHRTRRSWARLDPGAHVWQGHSHRSIDLVPPI